MPGTKISLTDKSISFSDFRTQFESHFLISYEPKRKAAMEKEYERATGRKPEEEKPKQVKSESVRPKGNDKPVKGNDSGSDAKADTSDNADQGRSSD